MSPVSTYDDAGRRWLLAEGNSLALMPMLPSDSADAVVCDPPYGLDFHDESWDRLGDGAAFERFSERWAREALRVLKPGGHLLAFGAPRTVHRLASGIEDAGFEIRDQLLWIHAQGIPKSRRLPGGLGTGLKPAYEPILLARKPLVGTTTANLARFGTGALGIEAAGIERPLGKPYWPAHLALSHHPDCPAAHLDGEPTGPSRLFLSAKATSAERDAGCEHLPPRETRIYTGNHHRPRIAKNHHPTVKPIALLRWLIRLAVPAGGLVVDPFAGSGTTGIAALLEGRRFVGFELEPDYLDVACARLAHWAREAP
jgi:DNA modification methylase